jgi:hypothetical protein
MDDTLHQCRGQEYGRSWPRADVIIASLDFCFSEWSEHAPIIYLLAFF